MLGLPDGTVKLVPHSSEWQLHFETEKARLQESIGAYVVDIQHIGSTAIPGIKAKPIIDMMAGLRKPNLWQACVAPLRAMGYEPYTGPVDLPDWHLFIKNQNGRKTHHVHLVPWNGDFWTSRMLFREYLLRHPEVAEKYEELKLRLAKQYPNNRAAYTHDKGDFVRTITELAVYVYRRSGLEQLPLPTQVILPRDD